MPSGTQYAPSHKNQYGNKDINANFQGTKFTAAAGTQTTNDLKLNDDHLIDGGKLVVINSTAGDRVTLQVVDKDNIFGYGAGLVLGQYVTDWYMNPASTTQIDIESEYPAKILAGLYLRIIYDSISLVLAPTVICNYRLHKVLW